MAASAPRTQHLESSFPAASTILQQLAEVAIENPFRRSLLLHATSLLGVVRHCENTRRRMIAIAQEGINPFDQETIDPIFKGLYPELSFSALLEDADTDPFIRAGKLVHAALLYKDQPRSADARDSHLFGRTVALYKRGIALRKRFLDHPTSDFIVVAIGGSYFQLPVYEKGSLLPPDRLAATLSAIAEQAQRHPNNTGHGALTGFVDRDTIAAVHNRPIPAIDQALFLVALDLDATPPDTEALGRQVHIAGYRNRDYRKSLQLVVTANGKAGAVFSLFAGVEGVTAAQFLSAIAKTTAAMPPVAPHALPSPFTPIELPRDPDLTRTAETRLEAAIAHGGYSHRIESMSKDRIKALGVSPDAFFHAAMHLAYQRHFGRTPEAYNFIDLSAQRFGSISRYPCTTDALRIFLQQPTRENLLAALAAHKDAIAKVRSGNHPLHYAYHYLFASPGVTAILTVLLFTLLIPRFHARFLLPDLWLSNIPALPGLVSMCRHGTSLNFVRHHAYTCHYSLFPDHIRIGLSSHDETSLRDWPLKQSLADAFATLEALLRSNS